MIIKNFKFTDVTIQSKDPANPAVLTDLYVRDSSGLNFRDLELFVDPDKIIYSHQVYGSSDIHFDKLNVHGTMNGTPHGDKVGLMIRKSTDVSVSNSEFQQLWHGISFLDSKGVVIANNKFHDIQTDGVRGGGTSDIKVINNSFTDFYPAAGDHGDAVQFWTTGTSSIARDIEVSGNVITRGQGGIIQGIFFRDQVGDLPFDNVTIANNLVAGAMYNGIAIQGGTNVKVTGNTVAAYADMDSWIRLEKVDMGLLADNKAFKYVNISSSGISEINNATIGRVIDAEALLQYYLAGESIAPALEPEVVLKTVVGTDGDDRLSVLGDGFDTVVEAGAGNDVLTGGAGRNVLVGGTGHDIYIIKDLDDEVRENAGEGTDTVWASVNYVLSSNVEVLRLTGDARVGTGNELDNRLVGTAFGDTLSGLAGNDRLQGGAGDDTLFGGIGHDELLGDDGSDDLQGEAGDDRLLGGNGTDHLSGGEGIDHLEGGAGADILSGGAGADRFFYRIEHLSDGSIDTITDFSPAEGDRISLSAIDADRTTGIDDKFVFIGTESFSGKAGELRYEVKDGQTFVTGDTNGDKEADFTIHLAGSKSLAAIDFDL